jgi:hypothetical protein
MEEVERSGWVSEHQNTELDIEFLNVQHILDAEDDESISDGSEHVNFLNVYKERHTMYICRRFGGK